jgi:pimeloyl-ACP methyl ester carboxylesterase
LVYESVGSGEPVLLLHAGVADMRMWDAQVEAFAPTHRVIRFDAQGFGQSPAAAEPATRADDIHELLRSLDVPKAHVIGVSMGGAAAIDFAVAYPELVGTLVPVAAGLSGYEPGDPALVEWIEEREARQDALLADGDVDGATELDLEIWLAGPPRRVADMDQALVERLRPMARLARARRPERARTPQLDPPALGRLGAIQAPTLVMVGDCDVPLILDIADVIAQRIFSARKLVFRDTAHMINMERPAAFNQAVLEFVGAHPLS